MGLAEAMSDFFIKSTAEVGMISTSATDEQLEQTQRLGELQDDSEVSALTLGLESFPSVHGRRRQSQLPSSLNSSSSSSGGKSSGRFGKLILPLFSGIVACYLANEYVVNKRVQVSGGGIDHPNKPPTSTITALHQVTDTLTKEGEQDTRRATTELNDLHRNYYRGRKQEQQMLNMERKVIMSKNNDNGGQNYYSFEEGVDEDPVNTRKRKRILHHDQMYNNLEDWKENTEVEGVSFAGQKYRAVDGCLRNGEVQVDICLDSEHSSDLPVHCCAGSIEESDLICSRDNCEMRSTFAAAANYCEEQGMRLCSVAELESGACCRKGCGWNMQLSWTSDSCETSSSSTPSSNHPSIQSSLQPLTILPHDQMYNILQDWKENTELGAAPVVEHKYRAVDGCLRNGEVQVDICLDSEHTSDLPVHCCAGSMEENNLECSRDNCEMRSTFAAAANYCEEQGMRLCSVAELESGACCKKGCGWNMQLSWTSDRCETSSPSSSPSNQPSFPPSSQPTTSPSSSPSNQPTFLPSTQPSFLPSSQPTTRPSSSPSKQPTFLPSTQPTTSPSSSPSKQPTFLPSTQPTTSPSSSPSNQPSSLPSSVPTPHPSTLPSSQPTTSPSHSPSNQPSISMNDKEVGAGSFVEQMYRAADGCSNKGSEVQVDVCLASEHSSNVAVHCCAGSMEKNNLKCSRDKCVKKKTFAAAKNYCENQGMRLCSVAELESGACCDKGCGWNWQISWTSDRCETSNLSSSSSNQPRPSLRKSSQPTTNPTPSPSNQPTPLPNTQPSFLSSSQPSMSKNSKEVGSGSFEEQMYRAADGCINKGSKVGVDICLASEHSSNVAVHCCAGSMDESNLKCSRDKCVTRSSFAAAKNYCENRGMRLCSVAELESGACCDKGCGWNWQISWTSDSCETSNLSSSSSNQPRPSLRPIFQPTFTSSSSLQPTTTATFHNISSISGSFITSEAIGNPSLRVWEIISLTLAGIFFFCFAALGYHFVQTKRKNNSMPNAEEEEGTGWLSWLLSLWPSEDTLDESEDTLDESEYTLDEASAPAGEEEAPQEEGDGWLSWQSSFQPGGERLDQNKVVSASAQTADVPEEEGDGWLSRQTQFWVGGDWLDQLSDEDSISHSASSSGSKSYSSASASSSASSSATSSATSSASASASASTSFWGG